ncbi:transaldolase family protein [Halalkalibacter alkalisediminis]|uniref:Transaldolase family protein n=1 Tax=Halalkalibacter alkalisediminis TaxID=935616 RepID=A0ABV6NIE8_9BACI|nr:transaldolase family protein [Halalkalibacter alkalisediminis]
MKLLIDSADIKSIKHLIEYYQIEGVTTNPTILTMETANYWEQLRQIRSIIGQDKMFFVQTLAVNSTEIIEEALKIISELDENVHIKVPVIDEGYKALKELNRLGIKTLATAIFTAQQALMAAKCGANFVAPYVNRIDNVSGDGINVVSEIVKLSEMHQLSTEVLAASFKNVNQVHQCSLVGAHSITASPDIIEQLHSHPSSAISVKQFSKDWEARFGSVRI